MRVYISAAADNVNRMQTSGRHSDQYVIATIKRVCALLLLSACIAPSQTETKYPYTYYKCSVLQSDATGEYKAERYVDATGLPISDRAAPGHEFIIWAWHSDLVDIEVKSLPSGSWQESGELIVSLKSEYPQDVPDGSTMFFDLPGGGYEFQGWPKGHSEKFALPFLVYHDWSDFLGQLGDHTTARIVIIDQNNQEISSNEISLEPFRAGQKGLTNTIIEMDQKTASFDTGCERGEVTDVVLVF